MRFIKLDRDTKLEELAAIAYAAPGPGSGDAVKRAGAALLNANPRLAGLTVVPRGTSVVVPELAGLSVSPKAESPATVGAELLDDVRAALKPAFDHLRDAAKRDAEEAAKALKLLGSASFKKLVQEQAATAAARVAEAEKALRERQKDRERLLKTLPAVLATAGKDLDELKRRLRAKPI